MNPLVPPADCVTRIARWVLVWVCCVLLPLARAGAEPDPSGPHTHKVEIEVRDYQPARRVQTLELALRYHVHKLSPGQPLELLNMAGHWRDPVDQDEIVASTLLHHRYLAPSIEVLEAAFDGVPVPVTRVGPRKDLRVLAPKSHGVLAIKIKLQVPRGPWPLGCVRRRCAVVGGLVPLPVQEGATLTGHFLRPRIYQVTWKAAQKPPALWIHDSRSAKGPVLAPALFWGKSRGPRRSNEAFWYRGLRVRVLHARSPAGSSLRHEGFWPWPRNQREHLARLAKEAIDTALAFGLRLGVQDPLTLVVGPLGGSLAQSYRGLVVVSDRYLDSLPRPRFSKFHDTKVVHAMLKALTLRAISPKARPQDLSWLSGVMASSMVSRWQTIRAHRNEDMADLLAPVGFLPGVDDLLYSGQSSQAGVYFKGGEDQTPLRRHPMRFANQVPSSRAIAGRLQDKLGQDKYSAWLTALVDDPAQDPVVLASTLYGQDLADFFAQWLSPPPSVDYEVQSTSSRRVPQGWRHRIEVARHAEVDVDELVKVQVRDRKGNEETLTWRPRGRPHQEAVLEVTTLGKLAHVEIDPQGELQEQARTPTRSWERGAHGDPKFNNRVPPRLRWVYTGFYIQAALAEMFTAKTAKARARAVAGYLNFEAGRKRDLRRQLFVNLSKGRDTWVSGRVGMSFQLGKKITGNRRRWRLRAQTGVDWLSDGGLDEIPGIRTVQRLSLSQDTRRYWRAPEGGYRVSMGVHRSDVWALGSQVSGRHRASYGVSASAARYVRITHNHVLALLASASLRATQGQVEYRSLLRVGGIGGLSAFSADEVLGRGILRAAAEYRHVFLDTLRANLAGLAFLRKVGGVAFAGVASVAPCESLRGWGAKGSYLGQVGYGLTFRYDLLGISPQLMRLDVAVPVNRQPRTCLGARFPDKLALVQGLSADKGSTLLAPFSFNLTFAHAF